MRLLHAASLKFKDFPDAEIPPYAILSHTWEDKQEVTLQDMASPYLTDKKGYAKITATCSLALERGLEYAWIDTCCIDKTNNTELTESINSMFHWYQNAAVCLVHLVDLDVDASRRDARASRIARQGARAGSPAAAAAAAAASPDRFADGSPGSDDNSFIVDVIRRCVWFKRGWTLQELLAPRTVEFYDTRWTPIGSKTELAPLLSEITYIPVPAILGEERLGRYSTAQRMAWASGRVTTKTEDAAYCLLGLFDVNMPLIYGEGHRAFQRLQEEIIKRTTDLTLFAWMPAQSAAQTAAAPTSPALQDGSSSAYMPLLASSPAEFAHCHQLSQFRNDDSEFTATNRGLRITTYLVLVPLSLDMDDSNTNRNSSLGTASEVGSTVSGSTAVPGGGAGSSSPALGPTGGSGSIARKKTIALYARYRYVLSIGYAKTSVSEIGIWLKKVGPGLFLREASPSLAYLSKSKLKYTNTTENHTFYILMHPSAATTSSATAGSAADGQTSAAAMLSPTSPHAFADLQQQQQQQPLIPPTSAAAAAAATAALAASHQLRAVYHPRLFPRGMYIPYFGDRGIYFSSFPPNSWDERTRIFCQPESRNDVVAFSCSSRQGPDGRDNLSFGVLVDYRQKRDAPRCLVINRHSLESRFLFVLSMRQQGEPVRWYVMENELPTISASKNVLRMQTDSGRTYEVVATIVEGRVQIDEHMVAMPTLDVKITNVTTIGVKVQ